MKRHAIYICSTEIDNAGLQRDTLRRFLSEQGIIEFEQYTDMLKSYDDERLAYTELSLDIQTGKISDVYVTDLWVWSPYFIQLVGAQRMLNENNVNFHLVNNSEIPHQTYRIRFQPDKKILDREWSREMEELIVRKVCNTQNVRAVGFADGSTHIVKL